MGRLSISRAWEETAAILGREGNLLAAVALALIVLPQVVLAVVGVPIGSQTTMLGEIIYVAAVLLGFAAQIALNRLAIGPSVTVREAIGQGFVRLLPVFLVLIVLAIVLVVIAILLAMVLSAAGLVSLPSAGQTPTPSLIILLILLAATAFAIFQLVIPIAAVETGNPIRLVSRSWQLGRTHYLRLLAFFVIVFVGVALVALAGRFAVGSVVVLVLGQPNPGSMSALVLGLVVGLIQAFFTVATAVMLARIYVQLADGSRHASVPKSGI
jgi:hypothetical protein